MMGSPESVSATASEWPAPDIEAPTIARTVSGSEPEVTASIRPGSSSHFSLHQTAVLPCPHGGCPTGWPEHHSSAIAPTEHAPVITAIRLRFDRNITYEVYHVAISVGVTVAQQVRCPEGIANSNSEEGALMASSQESSSA